MIEAVEKLLGDLSSVLDGELEGVGEDAFGSRVHRLSLAPPRTGGRRGEVKIAHLDAFPSHLLRLYERSSGGDNRRPAMGRGRSGC